MAVAHDTTAEADAAQNAALRAMGPEGRLIIGMALSDAAREMVVAGVRSRASDGSPEETRREVMRILLGEDLFRQVWTEGTAPSR